MTTKTKKHYGKVSLEKKLGPMTFGGFVSSWRESLGLSQVEFAKILEISPANLCDIEKGRQLVSPKKAAEIADKIGYSSIVLIELAINEQLALDGLKVRVKGEVA